jgi:thiamine kinase-like enzyme
VKALSPTEATARYSSATSRQFELIGSLVGGETGATAIREVGGERFVLKWESDPGNIQLRLEAITLAERLRTLATWPVPRQHAVQDDGWLFVSQEFMRGETMTRLTHRVVDDVLSLLARGLGRAEADDANYWAEEMIEILIAGGKGYCLHEPLRTHDARTRRVVERIEEIGRSLSPEDLAGHEIVHADLHPGNLLQIDGQLSAVVDLDYARVGDAAFDLACLAVASLGIEADPGVRKRLFAAGIDTLDRPRRRAYVGNLLLRNLDWPIRKNRPDEVEFWLKQSDRLLA